jgi:hypothetical protein
LTLTPNNPKIIRERQRAIESQKVTQIKDRTNEVLRKLDAGEWEAARSDIQSILTAIPSAPLVNAQQ